MTTTSTPVPVHFTSSDHFQAHSYYERGTVDVKVIRTNRNRRLFLELATEKGTTLSVQVRVERAFTLANNIVDALEEGMKL